MPITTSFSMVTLRSTLPAPMLTWWPMRVTGLIPVGTLLRGTGAFSAAQRAPA